MLQTLLFPPESKSNFTRKAIPLNFTKKKKKNWNQPYPIPQVIEKIEIVDQHPGSCQGYDY